MSKTTKKTDKKPAAKSDENRKRGKTLLGGKATEVIVKPHLAASRKMPDGRVVAEAVVIYGRMNPPTAGHEKLCEVAAVIAEQKSGIPLLYLSQTVNAKNPLTYGEKLSLCEEAFEDILWVVDERVKDPIDLLKKLNEDFSKVTLVCGSDGAKDFTRILKDYNGREFTFESTEVVTVDRDFDSETLHESISASTLRTMVVEGDYDGFAEGLPSRLRGRAKEIFNQVKFGLNLQQISESTTLDKAKKAIINLRNRK